MKYIGCSLLLGLMVAGCSSSASQDSSPENKRTYRMEKGTMGGLGHEMETSKTSDTENTDQRKKGYRMEKGTMGGLGHEMK